MQRTGRGHITAAQGLLVDTFTNVFEVTLPLKDMTSMREHGTGFVGGPAKIVAELFYEDPSLGVRQSRIEQEIKLSPGRGR